MTRTVVAALVVAAAGCGAAVDTNPIDGATTMDAASAADAIPGTPDAVPCTGVTEGGRCYEGFTMTPLTWGDALVVCQSRGGALTRIESAAENQIVLGLIGLADAWIGGTDQVTEMTWLWADGTPFTYTNWRTGEPNDGNGVFPEDCAIIEGDTGGTWDDRPCAPDPLAGVPGQYVFICER